MRSDLAPTVWRVDIGGWLAAWPGIVSAGWVLVVLVLGTFAAGVGYGLWVADRGAHRLARESSRAHLRQHLARTQRQAERAARDAEWLVEVTDTWPDVLAHLRGATGEPAWLDLRGARPVHVADGVRLAVEVDPDRLAFLRRVPVLVALRCRVLTHAVEQVTRQRFDVELLPAGPAVSDSARTSPGPGRATWPRPPGSRDGGQGR